MCIGATGLANEDVALPCGRPIGNACSAIGIVDSSNSRVLTRKYFDIFYVKLGYYTNPQFRLPNIHFRLDDPLELEPHPHFDHHAAWGPRMGHVEGIVQ